MPNSLFKATWKVSLRVPIPDAPIGSGFVISEGVFLRFAGDFVPFQALY